MSHAIHEVIEPLSAHLRKAYPNKSLEHAFQRWYAEMRFGKSGHANVTHHFVDGPGDLGIDYVVETQTGFVVLQAKFSQTSLDVAVPMHWYKNFEAAMDHLVYATDDDAFERWLNGSNKMATRDLYRRIRDAYAQRRQVRFVFLTTRPRGRGTEERYRIEAREEVAYLWSLHQEGLVAPFEELNLDLRKVQIHKTQTGRLLTAEVRIREILLAMHGSRAEGGAPDRLFDQNVRSYLGSSAPNRGIVASYKGDPDSFFAKHNGIYLIAPTVTKFSGRSRWHLRYPSVINGAQTLWSLYTSVNRDDLNNASVLVRVLETTNRKSRDAIIAATNTQNAMQTSALLAHHESLPEVARRLDGCAIFLERQQKSWVNQYRSALSGHRPVKVKEIIQWSRAAASRKELGSLRAKVAQYMLKESADDALHPLVRSHAGVEAARLFVCVAAGLLARRVPGRLRAGGGLGLSSREAARMQKEAQVASLLLVHLFSQAIGFSETSRQSMVHVLSERYEMEIPDALLIEVRDAMRIARRAQVRSDLDFSNFFKSDERVEALARVLSTAPRRKRMRDALARWCRRD